MMHFPCARTTAYYYFLLLFTAFTHKVLPTRLHTFWPLASNLISFRALILKYFFLFNQKSSGERHESLSNPHFVRVYLVPVQQVCIEIMNIQLPPFSPLKT
jgi:phosphoglycerol transferase MdoB-like AlkP superfamily enzyme